jgi:peptidyl-prolyl cis-trans isomerase SurA
MRKAACIALAAGAIAVVAGITPASAQRVHRAVVTVNNDVITQYDVNQRSRLVALTSGQKAGGNARSKALELLIDETLMKQEANRLNVSVPAEAVEKQIGEFASRNRLTLSQFRQAIQAQGIDPKTFERSVEAQLLAQALWPEVVRSIYGRQAEIRDEEIEKELERLGGAKISKRYEFTSRTITFVIPSNADSSEIARRQNDVDRIRRSFRSCDTAKALVRGMRDVVVGDLVHQTSDVLNAEAAKILAATEVNRTTPARRSKEGIQITAICSKTEVEDDKLARRKAEIKLMNEKFGDLARRHLDDLRRDARIEGELPPSMR